MNVPALTAAALAASAVTLLLAPRARVGDPPAPRAGPDVGLTRSGQHPLRRHRLLVSAGCALVPPVVLGGLLGLVGGLGVAGWVWRTVGALEPAGVRQRRERAARDLPYAVDLLGVVLSSGAAPSAALAAVVEVVDTPLGEELARVQRGLVLGRDPVSVWREAGERPGLSTLSRTMVRALDSGASVADALSRLAEDLDAAARLEGETRARSVGVKVAAPLGLCLLPAFVLVGVVPLVGSAVGAFLSS